MENPIKGSCQCGQVTYELKSKPIKVLACHCTECQKLSTSPFSVTAVVSVKDIEIFGELKEWSRSADSGNTNIAKFCPNCGNRIYHINPQHPELIKLKLKLKPTERNSTQYFKPTAHVWVSEKQCWYEIPEGIKAFDTQS